MSDCPVCRGMVQMVDGFEVRWKGSVKEPSLTSRGVYEIVIHPDGVRYRDWKMNYPISRDCIDSLRLHPWLLERKKQLEEGSTTEIGYDNLPYHNRVVMC